MTTLASPKLPSVFEIRDFYETGRYWSNTKWTFCPPPITVLELQILQCMQVIMAKVEWKRKILDPTILDRWSTESVQHGMTKSAFEYAVDECRWWAYCFAPKHGFLLAGMDNVYLTDGGIDTSVKNDLIQGADRIIDMMGEEKDWHPGSNQQVLDLVHPSLFPLVFRRSWIRMPDEQLVDDCACCMEILSLQYSDDTVEDGACVVFSNPCQHRFHRACLACWMARHKTCPLCRANIVTVQYANVATNTTNNTNKRTDQPPTQPIIHQQHNEIIQKWKQQLMEPDRLQKAQAKHKESMYYSERFQWIPCEMSVSPDGRQCHVESYINNLHPTDHASLYQTIEKVFVTMVPLFDQLLSDLVHRSDPRVDYTHLLDRRRDGTLVNDQVKIPHFHPFDFDKQERYSLAGKRIQVIVKMADIILTPENPNYPGGSWHIEGMVNEDIVASGIYYYQNENVTESRLHFRRTVRQPLTDQGDEQHAINVYDMPDGAPLNQELGSVITSEDRCLVFPNLYQHRVDKFSLEDTTRPGRRRILVFFLVNPDHQILSSERIPPQNQDWLGLPPNSTQPTTAWDMDRAKRDRLELMQERKFMSAPLSQDLFERPFSLCEH